MLTILTYELYVPDGQFTGTRAGSKQDCPAGHPLQLELPPVE